MRTPSLAIGQSGNATLVITSSTRLVFIGVVAQSVASFTQLAPANVTPVGVVASVVASFSQSATASESYSATATSAVSSFAQSANASETFAATASQTVASFTQATTANRFLPTDVSGCILWVRADLGVTSSGGLVTVWADQSGQGNNLTASGAQRPTVVAGPPPYLAFTAASQLLDSTFPALPQPYEYFVGFQSTSSAPLTQAFLVDLGASDTGSLFQTNGAATLTTRFAIPAGAFTINADHYAELIENGASSAFNLDGSSLATGNNNGAGTGGIAVGGAWSTTTNGFVGRIYEFALYNNQVSTSDRTKLNAYFASPH